MFGHQPTNRLAKCQFLSNLTCIHLTYYSSWKTNKLMWHLSVWRKQKAWVQIQDNKLKKNCCWKTAFKSIRGVIWMQVLRDQTNLILWNDGAILRLCCFFGQPPQNGWFDAFEKKRFYRLSVALVVSKNKLDVSDRICLPSQPVY